MSSPSLSDLGKSEQATLDERGTQQRRAGSNATWNSIQNAVIAVFQRKGLPDNELYSLNEGVRQLLKTELGSFFTEYLQNQLLTKGMVILRDKIRFYEGQKLLDTVAEIWDFFFCDILPMLQAIFCPVQGKEPTVRQIALLHFRNIITLNVKLEDALSRPRARVPPSLIQMLLILQGVHESKGVTGDYLRLEMLIQKVVSPYLGTYGLHTGNEQAIYSASFLEKRLFPRCSKPNEILTKNPVVRSKSYNNPMLTPVAEYESEGSLANGTSIRRHSVSEMTTCIESEGYLNLSPCVTTPIVDPISIMTATAAQNHLPGEQEPGSIRTINELLQCKTMSEPIISQQPDCFLIQGPREDQVNAFKLSSNPSMLPAASTSPESTGDNTLESVGTDSEGIFLDFGHRCSETPTYNRELNRQSVV
ncbi:proline-rich protein 5 isoform X1 [Stegostoma tigrinum]|nr:proline-rich protein 5 isoform X1 [Stegostoma tigrinum]XP_048404516.2 proline-rich protein 5 isoform X1 [Stegostoma tigrinum]XP_048404517.2 proline-rich protein 5 isoform X1 [Stegostoma tigrinum]XP_048404518.2 proline-rich protein 5 isoform X1 [Stegostoma tigrinum]XP_048404520.2 proline-rich protein 5 isoform X1 [Stegostoma tigrinum]